MPKPDEDLADDHPTDELWDADPECDHVIVALWSGVKCSKCRGWFCF